jgi:hypothetical protein
MQIPLGIFATEHKLAHRPLDRPLKNDGKMKTRCVASLLFIFYAAQSLAKKSAASTSVNRSVDEYINAQMRATGASALRRILPQPAKSEEIR